MVILSKLSLKAIKKGLSFQRVLLQMWEERASESGMSVESNHAFMQAKIASKAFVRLNCQV